MSGRTAKRVLLCRPNYFDVEYIINPLMKPHSVDKSRAMKQWQGLVAALESENITVETIDQQPDVPDMVYATDQGVVRNGSILFANFRYPQRKKETLYYRTWFKDHGFKLRSLTNVFAFEGGDSLPFNDMLLVGTGFRANVGSCEEVAEKLNVDVLPLRLINPSFYHLDMCFLPLDNDMAFYYPPAFSNNSQRLLKRFVHKLEELTEEEANAFAANSFVSNSTVFMQAGVPSSFQKKLEGMGKKVIPVDVSEFNKGGGGIHCMILPIEWEEF